MPEFVDPIPNPEFDHGQPSCFGLLKQAAAAFRSLGLNVVEQPHQTWLTVTGANGRTFVVDIEDQRKVGKATRPWR